MLRRQSLVRFAVQDKKQIKKELWVGVLALIVLADILKMHIYALYVQSDGIKLVADGSGGAIACSNCGKMTLSETTSFIQNTAQIPLPSCPRSINSYFISESGPHGAACTCDVGSYQQTCKHSSNLFTQKQPYSTILLLHFISSEIFVTSIL